MTRTLERSGDNVRASARQLGLSRERLYRLLDRGTRSGGEGARPRGNSGDVGED